MDLTTIPLFALADQRLAWLDRRQALLSQNVANVDTPTYRPQDLLPFGQALSRSGFSVAPVRTSPMHLQGTVATASGASRAISAEQAPDGNAVSLDDQLEHIADTDTAQALTTALYSKYLGMFRTAIGR